MTHQVRNVLRETLACYKREGGEGRDEQVGGYEKIISRDKKQTYFTMNDRFTETFSGNWPVSKMVILSRLKALANVVALLQHASLHHVIYDKLNVCSAL